MKFWKFCNVKLSHKFGYYGEEFIFTLTQYFSLAKTKIRIALNLIYIDPGTAALWVPPPPHPLVHHLLLMGLFQPGSSQVLLDNALIAQ